MNDADCKTRLVELATGDLGSAQDNLIRAQSAFRGQPPKAMAEKYGSSNETRQEIVDGYLRWESRAKQVLAYAKRGQR